MVAIKDNNRRNGFDERGNRNWTINLFFRIFVAYILFSLILLLLSRSFNPRITMKWQQGIISSSVWIQEEMILRLRKNEVYSYRKKIFLLILHESVCELIPRDFNLVLKSNTCRLWLLLRWTCSCRSWDCSGENTWEIESSIESSLSFWSTDFLEGSNLRS